MTWHLERDGEIIAELTYDGGDFPWMHGTLAARPAFEELRPMFVKQLVRLPGLKVLVAFRRRRGYRGGLWLGAVTFR